MRPEAGPPLQPPPPRSLRHPSISRPSVSPGERLSRIIERHEISSLGALLLFILLICTWVSHHRALWFDELFTLLVAGQPTWHDFALAMPPEGNPPLLTASVRELMHLLGPTAFAARLPSMLAFVAACAGVYAFVRRRCGPIVGLLAISIVLAQPGWSYAVESRPYALLLAFMMLSLVCWQRATSERPRAHYLAGMAIGIVGAITSHHIGVVTVAMPILFGEVARALKTRRPDWPLYATLLVALPALAWTFPMAHRTRAQLLILAIHRQPPITVHVLLDWLRNVKFNLPTLLAESSLAALALLIVVTWTRTAAPADTPSPRVPAHEVAAAAGAALLIPVTLVVLMLTSNYYNCRYGIGCLAGFAILGAFGVARGLGERRDLMTVLILIFTFAFITDAKTRTTWPSPSLPGIPPEFASQPIVLNNPFYFYPLWWYGTPDERGRLHFLFDMETAVDDNNAIPEASLMLERGRFPAHLDRFEDFIPGHDRFVTYIPVGLGDRIKARLQQSGFTLTPIGSDPTEVFEATREPSTHPE